MSAAYWKCYECDAEHPADWQYCPKTGINRLTAGTDGPEGVPRSWRSNQGGWQKFKAQLDELDEEELRCAGLQRIERTT